MGRRRDEWHQACYGRTDSGSLHIYRRDIAGEDQHILDGFYKGFPGKYRCVFIDRICCDDRNGAEIQSESHHHNTDNGSGRSDIMWTGGVRVVVRDEDGNILMVRQQHPEREIWLLPGGGIEEGETSVMAAVREVKEETGLDISVERMLWHVEQLKDDGEQRYVNFFLADVTGGDLKLGEDPEFDEAGQVLREVRMVSPDELPDLANVYPEFLKKELAGLLQAIDEGSVYDPHKIRKD